MTGLPPPPQDFAALKPRVELCAARDLLRVAFDARTSWCRFNREPRNRFDSPDGLFGVMYAAFDLPTAFAEAVLRQKPASTGAGLPVPLALSELTTRTVVQLDGLRELRLIPLYDYGLTAVHTDNRISTADDYPTTRLWAQALFLHPEKVDGLIYLSRYMAPHRSVALFDRCSDVIAPMKVTPLLQHPALSQLIDDFGLAIDPES
jgi:hypothetical protein